MYWAYGGQKEILRLYLPKESYGSAAAKITIDTVM